jgi:hypothetical protein
VHIHARSFEHGVECESLESFVALSLNRQLVNVAGG